MRNVSDKGQGNPLMEQDHCIQLYGYDGGENVNRLTLKAALGTYGLALQDELN